MSGDNDERTLVFKCPVNTFKFRENMALIKEFTTVEPEKMEKLNMALKPFFRDKALPWMQPDYVDSYHLA